MNILIHQVADYYRQLYIEDINYFGKNSPIGREWAKRLEKIDKVVRAADQGYTYTAETLFQLAQIWRNEI